MACVLLAGWVLCDRTAAAEEAPIVRLLDRLERLPSEVGAGARAEVDLDRLVRARRVVIELPDDQAVSATRAGLEERSGDDFLWTGRSVGGEQVVLTAQGGRLAGTVFGRGGVYQISPSGEGDHEVLRVDRDSLAGCGGAPRFDGAEPAAQTSGAPLLSQSRTPRVDLLVLYSARASAAAGSRRNMETIVQHFVDLTNVAFHNSEIDARVRLVHASEVTLPGDVLDSSAILSWLSRSAEIADLRATHGADLVGIVHGQSSNVCGSASMIYRPGGPTLSRAFFESRRVCGADTFAHEVGHLLGADHNPEDAVVAAGEYIYGRGHYHDGRYRTIMSYASACRGDCPSQPFFSNPSVRHDRRATGLRNERDNARIINELSGFVAGFAGGINDPNICGRSPGDADYCLECGQCFAGEGNCESDSECDAGLDCVAGSGADFGLGAKVGVCQVGDGCNLDPGDPDYCRLCGPCGYGDGDCDSNRECQAGLTCLDDVGSAFGLAASSDVCGFRLGDFCPFDPGHPDFCSACGPCEPGEGGCKADSECVVFADCFRSIGAEFGFKSGTNVCLRAAPEDCPFSTGASDYCRVCGICDEGEGDCDTDRECSPGLTCVDGAGARFGFGDDIDLCLKSESGSGDGALAAPKRLKVRALSPTRVRLKWKDKSKGEEGFHVEMSRQGGPFSRIATTEANTRKLFVGKLESGVAYAFRVQAFNAAGTSAYTREVTVTTP